MAPRFILAISTSSGVAKVAVATQSAAGQGTAIAVYNFEIADYKSQSAKLLPMIQAHLQDTRLQADQCAAIAVDVGPGGFTSLRTACGIAQGLAVAWNVPVVPMSSFECMLPEDSQDLPVTVLIDARLNEIYAATISRSPAGTQWIKSPFLLAVNELASVRGPVLCDAQVLDCPGAPAGHARLSKVSAVRLASMAWQEFEAGRIFAPFDCQPMYVRDKVAQTTSERQALKNGAV